MKPTRLKSSKWLPLVLSWDFSPLIRHESSHSLVSLTPAAPHLSESTGQLGGTRKKMKAPLSCHPQPYGEPLNSSERGPKGGAGLLLSSQSQSQWRHQHCAKAVTAQTPGQLIDLHYSNYSGDMEQGIKNGSHCCAILPECVLLHFLQTLKTSLGNNGAA